MTDVGLPLDESYLDWLIDRVSSGGKRPLSYHIFKVLYTTPFYSPIPNDYNRAMDGMDLRGEYFEVSNFEEYHSLNWMDLECSVLEMVIALSERASYYTGEDSSWWFEEMMAHLRIGSSPAEVPGKIRKLLYRDYHYNGGGGLFPLRYPEVDQRTIELWDQMSAYIIENQLY